MTARSPITAMKFNRRSFNLRSNMDSLTIEDGWLASWIECVECGHRFAGVYPVSTDEGSIECIDCGEKNSNVIERIMMEEG